MSAPALGLAVRAFAAPVGQPRARRGTDVVLLVPALLGLAALIAAYPPGISERALERFFESLPGWLDPVWEMLANALWLWAAVLVVAALVRRRVVVVGQAVTALALALLVAVCATRLAVGAWPDVAGATIGSSGAPRFPTVWVAEAMAVVLTISPHLVRPLQVLSRRLLVLALVGTAIVAGGTPSGTLAAVLIAIVVAAGIRLAWGTSIGRPGLENVAAGLAELGVEARALEDAERQVAGVYHVRAVDRDGRRLLVKVYGRDAYDTQLVARLWRRVWYRGSGPAPGLGRLQAAEHEAFVTLLAANGGVPTRAVVTAGRTVDDDALLVLRGQARPLAALDAPDDDVLRAAWSALALLGELRIAHGQIDPATAVLVEGEAGFVDFGAAEVAPDADQLRADRAQLLMTTVLPAGPERAIDAAIAALGAEEVAAVLPYLQSAAFAPALRRALKLADVDVDEIRQQAAATLGVEPPELVRVRRLSASSVAQLALLVFATYGIVSAAGGVDWDRVGSTLVGASWAWAAAAAVVAQLPRVGQAIAMLGAVPRPLPFGPVYGMQLASGYMNVALPSSVARMAVSVRFFQRQGLSVPSAVSAGLIDTGAQAAVQAALLAALLVFSEASLELDLPLPEGSARTLLWILAAALGATLALALVAPVRRTIATRVRQWWPDVRIALASLRASHKLARLLLGNAAAELLFAIALGLFARSLGYDLTLAELLVIQVSVALVAGIILVPGGVGVAELGLTVGLVSAGMTEEAALAAALMQRIATFYLPPLWGFFALRRLQANRYL